MSPLTTLSSGTERLRVHSWLFTNESAKTEPFHQGHGGTHTLALPFTTATYNTALSVKGKRLLSSVEPGTWTLTPNSLGNKAKTVFRAGCELRLFLPLLLFMVH